MHRHWRERGSGLRKEREEKQDRIDIYAARSAGQKTGNRSDQARQQNSGNSIGSRTLPPTHRARRGFRARVSTCGAVHSARRASLGSIDEARRAGTYVATNAAALSTNTTQSIVGRSQGLVANNMVRRILAAAIEPTIPPVMPSRASQHLPS